MANTSAIRQQAAHTTNQLSSPSCLTRAIQKSQTQKIFESFLEKKSGERTITISRKMTRQKGQEIQAAKKKTKKKTREEINRKGESNDSPEIPDGSETSNIPSLPSEWISLDSLQKRSRPIVMLCINWHLDWKNMLWSFTVQGQAVRKAHKDMLLNCGGDGVSK